METVVYRVTDGVEIHADVYGAAGNQPGPAVLFFHGGGLIMGDRSWIAPKLVTALTASGIAVVSADYRLAPETKLPAIVSDVTASYEWVRGGGGGEFSFDPDRIAVMGGSAGGYLALLGGSMFSPSPKAVVSFYGYGDVTGPWYSQPDPFYNTLPPVSELQAREAVGTKPISQGSLALANRYDFYLYCRQQGTWPTEVCGRDPSDAGWYRGYEPVRNVTPGFPPTLLLHGESDTDVPVEQSLLMAEQFKTHGVPHQLVTNPSWEHAFDLAQNGPSIDEAIDHVTAFLTQHLIKLR